MCQYFVSVFYLCMGSSCCDWYRITYKSSVFQVLTFSQKCDSFQKYSLKLFIPVGTKKNLNYIWKVQMGAVNFLFMFTLFLLKLLWTGRLIKKKWNSLFWCFRWIFLILFPLCPPIRILQIAVYSCESQAPFQSGVQRLSHYPPGKHTVRAHPQTSALYLLLLHNRRKVQLAQQENVYLHRTQQETCSTAKCSKKKSRPIHKDTFLLAVCAIEYLRKNFDCTALFYYLPKELSLELHNCAELPAYTVNSADDSGIIAGTRKHLSLVNSFKIIH